MDNRGIATDPGWINRKFRELERAIEALRSERRASATTIGSGGFVVDGGDVVMLDDDGSVMFRLGMHANGDRGFTMARQDGSAAITVSRAFPGSTQQELRLYDRHGTELVTEEAVGSGLARPIFDIPTQPVLAASGAINAGPYGFEVPIASGTYTAVARAQFVRNNQFGTFILRIAASDITTAAEVRAINLADGLQMAQLFSAPYTATRATGTTDYVEVTLPSLLLPGAPWTSQAVALEVRRSAGAGTLRVAVTESRGG